MFYISLLEPYHNRKSKILIIFNSIFIENQKEWTVEQILAIKIRKNKFREYVIRWKDFFSAYNFWQSEKNMNNENELIEQF
jgi:hypothetical protein